MSVWIVGMTCLCVGLVLGFIAAILFIGVVLLDGEDEH